MTPHVTPCFAFSQSLKIESDGSACIIAKNEGDRPGWKDFIANVRATVLFKPDLYAIPIYSFTE